MIIKIGLDWFSCAVESCNNFIMSVDSYSPTLKERLNPEFVGIASKYSDSKQRRLSIEKERDTHLRTLKYKISVDVGLDKNLEEQR